MTIEEQRRKAFDIWHRAEQEDKWQSALKEFGLEPEPMPEQFLQAAKLLHWRIWNAALDSVEIELPSTKTIGVCSEYNRGVREYGDAVRCSLESSGLKVKL